jgi:hypothetical protein
MQRNKRRVFRTERLHLLGLTDHGLEVTLGFAVVDGYAAALAMEQELHAGQPALQLANAGNRANSVEGLRLDRLGVLALGDGKDELIGCLQGRFDGAQRARASGTNRRRHPREQHDLAQRQHGQGQSFGHRFSLGGDQCVTMAVACNMCAKGAIWQSLREIALQRCTGRATEGHRS